MLLYLESTCIMNVAASKVSLSMHNITASEAPVDCSTNRLETHDTTVTDLQPNQWSVSKKKEKVHRETNRCQKANTSNIGEIILDVLETNAISNDFTD